MMAFALVAAVLTVSALASGIVERAPLSFPIIFLGLGFLLGQRGIGLLTLGPEDAVLESVAVLTLALVLFLDAVRLREGEMSGAGLVPMLSLGPGTLIIVAVVALGAHLLLGPAAGFAVGAGGAWLMSTADARFSIRSEYQALYGIGLVLLAFAGAQEL